MKICFNEATTMKNSSLEQDLKYCEKYGYDFIEIRLDKLKDYLKSHSVKDLANFFKKSKIKPYAFNALEFILFRDEAGINEIKENLKFLCEVGDKINCRKIVVVPTFNVGAYTKTQIKNESIRVINKLADIAEMHDTKLAYEFVGYPHCAVNTFGQAYDIITSIDRSNVGIVLDCFHFHAMNSRIEDLQKADPKHIFILHIDDCEDLPAGSLTDDKRLWPGDGCINLNLILSTLKKIGYKEMASVELFRPEYWNMEIEQTIKIGKEKTEKVVSKYFEIG